MLTTLHELIRELELLSSNIADMGLTSKLQDAPLDGRLINLANGASELGRICRAIDGLVNGSGFTAVDAEQAVRNLLTDRQFYGSYCELGAYEWLERNNAPFMAQVALTGQDVLNPNGCAIDGQFKNYDVYFDIKGFGMQAYLMELLKEKLQPFAKGLTVSINGPLDVSVKDIETYALRMVGQLQSNLAEGAVHKISELGWDIHVRKPQRMAFSEHTDDPYAFAENNRYYPFKTARQFTRNAPFILVFPYAAQFNSILAANVFDATDTALRALARRVFIQLTADLAPLNLYDQQTSSGLTVGDAARLISGLLFINLDKDDGWLFLNPRATHKLSKYHLEQMFDFTIPNNLGIEGFEHDNY